MPNILVYDTSARLVLLGGEGSGLPLEIVAFLAHSHPTIINEHRSCFQSKSICYLAKSKLRSEVG